MPIISRSRNKILPPNARTADVARKTLNAAIPVQNQKTDAAFRVNGYGGVLYRYLTSGIKCACQAKDRALNARLDLDGKASSSAINEMMTTSGTFGVRPYAERKSYTQAYAAQKAVFEVNLSSTRQSPAPIGVVPLSSLFDENDLEGANRHTEGLPDRIDYDAGNLSASLIEEEDTSSDVTRLISDFDTSLLGHSDVSCPICFGSGYIGGYEILQGYRKVFNFQDPSIVLPATALIAIEEDIPNILTDTVSWKMVFPSGCVGIDAFRVWNDTTQVFGVTVSVDNIPLADERELLRYCDGFPHTITLNFLEETHFTHLEFQLDQSNFIANFELPKLSKSSSQSLREATDPFSINLSPRVPAVKALDVIVESTFGKALQVKSVTGLNDKQLTTMGWEVEVRPTQPQELFFMLPRRKPLESLNNYSEAPPAQPSPLHSLPPYIPPTSAPKAGFSSIPSKGAAPLTVEFVNTSVGEVLSLQWDFGDGTTSTEANPIHVYSQVGVYAATLTVNNGSGTSAIIKNITSTIPLPVSRFTASPDHGTLPLPVHFVDTSVGVVDSWLWNFGEDSVTSTEQHPSHTYTAEGQFEVSLTVTNSAGSTTSTHTIISGAPAPIAGFISSPSTGIAPLKVAFTNTTSGVVTSYLWDFGDGIASAEKEPVHTYVSAGQYDVSMTATNAAGSDSQTQTIVSLVPLPVANFSTTPDSGTLPLTVAFLDTSTGPIDQYLWNFGDGNTSTEQSPTHVYTRVGEFVATLTVLNSTGESSATKTIGSLTPLPVVSFTATPDNGPSPITVSFVDTTTGTVVSRVWDFGDGTTSKMQNPTHTYSTNGTREVTLTATNSTGSNTAKTLITSFAPAPTASFTATPTEGVVPFNVTFTDTSLGTISTRQWDFGDGSFSTDKNPTHTYSTVGQYAAVLSVTNGTGTSTASARIDSKVPAPVASFTSSVSIGSSPLTVSFNDTSTGVVTSRHWDFGDDSTATEQNPTHTYADVGTYTTVLTVADSTGSSSAAHSITSVVAVPVASFETSTSSGIVPLTVLFTDTSTGTVSSRLWDFGDGNTSTAQNPTHTYSTAGKFNAKLTLINTSGSTSTSHEINSQPAVPVAAFTATPSEGTAPLKVSFTSNTSGVVDSYHWNFGDGATSSSKNPVYTYPTPGNFNVTLIATNTTGVSSVSHTIISKMALQAVMSYTQSADSSVVNFRDESLGPVSNWLWNFGDGTTSNEKNPTHVYTTAGDFVIALTVSNSTDTSSTSDHVSVTASVTASFLMTPNSGIIPLDVVFTDTSLGVVDSYLWNFGDGTTSTEKNPAHTYSVIGRYTVSLTVTGTRGSSSTSKVVNSLLPIPVSNFTASPDSGTTPLTVSFNDTSTGVVTSRLWDFGDGNSSTASHPVHKYTDSGTFTASLTVGNSTGSTTSSHPIASIVRVPVAKFTLTPDVGSIPLSVNFVDKSTGTVSSHLWDFGDGTTSTEASPTHVYTTAGNFVSTLTVTNSSGSNSTSKPLVATVSTPVASFTANPSIGMRPVLVSFTDTSSGVVTSRLWNFGDGTASTEASPSHLYDTVGDYKVTLAVSNEKGSSSTTQTIGVLVDLPVAAFTPTPSSGLAPLTVAFVDQSSGTIDSYLWNFGDGSASSNVKNPTYTYAVPGEYVVTLTVTNKSGSNSTVHTVSSRTDVSPPVAAFSVSESVGQIPFYVAVTDHSTGVVNSWHWDFGDGTTSNLQNPDHTYTAIGAFNITLTVTNSLGSTSAVHGINAVVPVPTVGFTYAIDASALTKVVFTDTSTGVVNSWHWDFGDGTTSTDQNPTHEYLTGGNFLILFSVSNTTGESSIQSYVRVVPAAPYANYTYTTSVDSPTTVHFTDTSTGIIDSYLWDFGDGSTSVEQNPTHTYAASGTFAVNLKVSNSAGGSALETAIVVGTSPLYAAFSSNQVSTTPLAVDFLDQSTGSPIDSWLWYFGDGTSTSFKTRVRALLNSGCLLTFTDTGMYFKIYTQGDIPTDIVVTPYIDNVAQPEVDWNPSWSSSLVSSEFDLLPYGYQAPTANTVAFLNVIEARNYIAVTQQPSPSNNQAVIDWHDVSTTTGAYYETEITLVTTIPYSSTEQNPSHIYLYPGSYDVSLTVNNASYSDTTHSTIVVAEAPQLTSRWSEYASGPLTLYFFDESVGGPIDSWLWDFGDYSNVSFKIKLRVLLDGESLLVFDGPIMHWESLSGPFPTDITVTPYINDVAQPDVVWDPGWTPDSHSDGFDLSTYGYTPLNDSSVTSVNVIEARNPVTVTQQPIVDNNYQSIIDWNDSSTGTPAYFEVEIVFDTTIAATSTEQNPTYTYSYPGVVTVSLTVTKGVDSSLSYSDVIVA